jgi:hypothetical protein
MFGMCPCRTHTGAFVARLIGLFLAIFWQDIPYGLQWNNLFLV